MGPLIRLPDWQPRLSAWLRRVNGSPIQPGRHDCCLFGAGAIEAQTGIDIAAAWRGRYGAGAPSVTPTVTISGALELNLTGMIAGTAPLIEAAITGSFSGVTATGLAPNLDATVTVGAQGVTLALAAGTGQVGVA